MAYTRDNKGLYHTKIAGTWETVAMWTSGDQVELIAEGNTNLPNSMGAAVSLETFITAFDGAIAAANGFATLGADGKLDSGQLPAALAGGLSYQGTVDGSVADLDTAFTPALAGDATDQGKYWVVTTAGNLPNGATITWEANAYDDGEAAGGATLEIGDILLCTADGKMTVLSNTYGDATTAGKGVVQLSDVATRATLAGDHVITEAILATILNDDLLTDADFGATPGYMKVTGDGTYTVEVATFLTQTAFDTNNPALAALELNSDTAGALVKTGADSFGVDATFLQDADFSAEGFMKRGATAGAYSIDTTVYQTQVTVDAAAPTGGADNDIWVQTS